MRCFLAIELPHEVADRLAALQKRLGALDRDVRWTRVEQIHLTIKFLGEVPDADVPRICEIAVEIARQHSPFELEVKGTGCFPPRGPARVVWAGLAELPPALVDYHKAIEAACAEVGFKPEDRPFHPHLTIGRVRDQRGAHQVRRGVHQESNFQGGRFAVNELVMFQSILAPSGPTYIPLAHTPLGR
jgi:RNA 2',3'-cyclic 3'-phosphodiesterase